MLARGWSNADGEIRRLHEANQQNEEALAAAKAEAQQLRAQVQALAPANAEAQQLRAEVQQLRAQVQGKKPI